MYQSGAILEGNSDKSMVMIIIMIIIVIIVIIIVAWGPPVGFGP